MNHAILILQRAFCKDELAACDDQALPFIQIGCDDDIGDAGFVLHRKKDEPLGCAGPLPCDDAACGPHKFTIFTSSQFLRGKNALPAQFRTPIVPWGVCQLSVRCRRSLQLQRSSVFICCSGRCF